MINEQLIPHNQDQASMNQFMVDVIYAASAEEMKVLPVSIEAGTTMFDTVLRSGIIAFFPEIDLNTVPMGVFGKVEPKPKTRVMQQGERIEIYRPLLIDPKVSRQKRAERIREQKLAH